MFYKICLLPLSVSAFSHFLRKKNISVSDNFALRKLLLPFFAFGNSTVSVFISVSFCCLRVRDNQSQEEGVGSSGLMSCPEPNPFYSFPGVCLVCLCLRSSRNRPPTHLPRKHQADKQIGCLGSVVKLEFQIYCLSTL